VHGAPPEAIKPAGNELRIAKSFRQRSVKMGPIRCPSVLLDLFVLPMEIVGGAVPYFS
jgi:hypothetical protein